MMTTSRDTQSDDDVKSSPGRGHALVTGAGTGIGRATALRLAADGWRLTLMGRSEATLEETAARITSSPGSGVAVAVADITDRVAVETALERTVGRFGPLGAVIANSGQGGPNQPGPGDRFSDLVQVNLIGTYNTLRAAQRVLAPAAGPRHMVVVASILARIGVAGYTGYCASKTGLLGLVRALAQELAPEEVMVNAICPGWVDTEMARAGISDMAREMEVDYAEALGVAMAAVPLGRMSAPGDVAAFISWLVGGEARGITGQSLDINNGAWM